MNCLHSLSESQSSLKINMNQENSTPQITEKQQISAGRNLTSAQKVRVLRPALENCRSAFASLYTEADLETKYAMLCDLLDAYLCIYQKYAERKRNQ